MRKLILISLMAATVLPSTAMAQPQREVRQERSAVYDQKRVPAAVRHDSRNAVSERDRNWGRNDWRTHRNSNRALYARGHWKASVRYQTFRTGAKIQPAYYNPKYRISDPWRYHLPRAKANQQWVRHYDDVLLVDTRRGVVVDVIRNFFW